MSNIKDFEIEDGVLTKYKGNDTEVVIPEGVTSIGDRAFWLCKSLASIIIPDGVTSIGEYSFMDCDKLTSIKISDKVKNIGDSAFCDTSYYDNSSNWENGVLYIGSHLIKVSKSFSGHFEIKNGTTSVAAYAFEKCEKITSIVIPDSVAAIHNSAFKNSDYNDSERNYLNNISVSNPQVLPKDVRDFVIKDFLEKYVCKSVEEKYVDGYLLYIRKQRKNLLKSNRDFLPLYLFLTEKKLLPIEEIDELIDTTNSVDIKKVLTDYKNSGLSVSENVERLKAHEEKAASAFKPDVSKKLSEQAKVKLLEETVLKGTIEDVIAVLRSYSPFEITARALGIAGRYRGLLFVKTLVEAGATFVYDYKNLYIDPAFLRKYRVRFETAAGYYYTMYYMMLVPSRIDLDFPEKYSRSSICGVSHIDIDPIFENRVLRVDERLEIVRYLNEKLKSEISLDEMLYLALTEGEFEFADGLIEMGVDLNTTPPIYYAPWCNNDKTYVEIISSGATNVYWNNFVSSISNVNSKDILSFLKTFHSLLQKSDKRLMITKKIFESVKWSDESLSFALQNADISKIPPKSALEYVVKEDFVVSLGIMTQLGWLKKADEMDNLLVVAKENNSLSSSAYLIDYKNRTVDIVAEEAKKEAKMLKELNEKPDSVSELKKIWKYKDYKDGLIITEYKGDSKEIQVPATIGKKSVLAIGDMAFSPEQFSAKNIDTRKEITRVDIPNGIKYIEKYAFENCASLETVTIPDSLVKFDNLAFEGCSKLVEIICKNNKKIVSEEGIIYNKNKTELLFCSSGKESVSIMDGVNKIADDSFRGCGKIETVAIPDSVTSIGNRAFLDCAGLEKLIVPNNVTYIGKCAFEGCGSLASIVIPYGVTSIYDSTFKSCINLTSVTIPDSVTSIGKYAFDYCENLKEIKIPNSVTNIESSAFRDCHNLKSIEIPEKITRICYDVFMYCSKLESISIPNSVSVIGSGAFVCCDNLTNITIPDNTTNIGDKAFLGCSKLSSITIPDSVTSIGYRAFEDCKNLVIYASKGSYAEKYALKEGIKFVSTGM